MRGIMIILAAGVLLLAASCREASEARPAAEQTAAALERGQGDFPSESLAESGDCYSARLDYPFLGRPALDEVLRAKAGDIFREARDGLKSQCSSGKEEKEPLYEFTADYRVFSSPKVISVLFDLYAFTGGAHGLSAVYPFWRTTPARPCARNWENTGCIIRTLPKACARKKRLSNISR